MVVRSCGSALNRGSAPLSALVGLAALALPLVFWWLLRGSSSVSPPNLLLIVVDTLRADHLGIYGYHRNTSPNLDSMAARGIVLDAAQSVAPWTNPAIVSLFTGLYPEAVLRAAPHREAIRQAIPARLDTLAQRLKRAGYRTVALVDHPGIVPSLNFAAGFDVFERLYLDSEAGAWDLSEADYVFARVQEHLQASSEAPLFVYLHVVYPHRPYEPPPSHQSLFGAGFERNRRAEREGMINMYDAEIRYTDDLIGRIDRFLRDSGLATTTWMLVTSDHGEGFWEHERAEHGNSMFEELLHIPMILVPPGGRSTEPARIEERISLVDVLPTVLDIAGVGMEEPLDGQSFLGLLRGESPELRRPIFGESPHRGDLSRAAVYRGRYKYSSGAAGEALYDLESDPLETHPLTQDSLVLQSMSELLDRHRARNQEQREAAPHEAAPHEAAPPPKSDLDEDTVTRLRALGYVDS